MNLMLIIALILGGCLMLATELFVPGGVIGVLGLIALIAGLAGIFVNYGVAVGMVSTIVIIIVAIVVFKLWITFFSRSRAGRKFMALTNADAESWLGYDPELQALVGQNGIAHTQLRPSGVVIINDKRYHVVTRGELIAAQTAITVVEVHGNRIVVEAAEEQQSNENTAGEQK
ncbi:MAG: hypothetical protein GX937_05605 [Lentisphaerae bacterium]|jgi:membrane-bound serine protease (ClpP class)|nr:hypothetical protein [Lentisphaerota bacterium]